MPPPLPPPRPPTHAPASTFCVSFGPACPVVPQGHQPYTSSLPPRTLPFCPPARFFKLPRTPFVSDPYCPAVGGPARYAGLLPRRGCFGAFERTAAAPLPAIQALFRLNGAVFRPFERIRPGPFAMAAVPRRPVPPPRGCTLLCPLASSLNISQHLSPPFFARVALLRLVAPQASSPWPARPTRGGASRKLHFNPTNDLAPPSPVCSLCHAPEQDPAQRNQNNPSLPPHACRQSLFPVCPPASISPSPSVCPRSAFASVSISARWYPSQPFLTLAPSEELCLDPRSFERCIQHSHCIAAKRSDARTPSWSCPQPAAHAVRARVPAPSILRF